MNKQFRPMLAPNEDPLSYERYFEELRYPLLASPKYDGIRGIVHPSGVMSRSYKLLPSVQVQDEFSKYLWADGELIEGSPTDFGVYNRTQSHVMSESKPGNLSFWTFDSTAPDVIHRPFYERLVSLDRFIGDPKINIVPHTLIEDHQMLLEFEEKQLNLGFEGIMMRDPVGPYKLGRGTWREGYIYKLKRFEDAEAEIVGFEEAYTNQNVLETNELGFAKRSQKKEGMVLAGTLGKFIVQFEGNMLTVACGSFTHEQRKMIWENQLLYKGHLLKFRFMRHGMKDLPRFPRALGFRDPFDL